MEGFLPYVSGSPAHDGSRRRPIIIGGVAALALIAFTIWLAWPKQSTPPTQVRAPIILPPPVTVSQQPKTVSPPRPNADTLLSQRSEQIQADLSNVPRAGSTAQSTEPQQPAQREIVARTPNAAAAVTEVRESPRIEPAPVRPSVDYEAQATLLFNAGDLAGARDKFVLATRVAPSARVWTNYGVTLQRLGDLHGALAAYRSAVGIDGNYLEAWLYQGRVAVEQGDLTRAVPLFQRALAINPRNADANVELARLEYESQNWTQARRFAEAALRGDATNVRAYWYLAVASDPLKDTEAAIRGYTGYLRFVGDPSDQAKFIGWARTRLEELRGKP
jgi:tetratricopeptide (TPR) repeat protein